jgi:hypothetical protein
MGTDEAVHEPEGSYQFDPLSSRVIAAAIAVLKQPGPGFREEVYENAICVELERRALAFAGKFRFRFDTRRVGFLMNFHSHPLTIKRLVNRYSG